MIALLATILCAASLYICAAVFALLEIGLGRWETHVSPEERLLNTKTDMNCPSRLAALVFHINDLGVDTFSPQLLFCRNITIAALVLVSLLSHHFFIASLGLALPNFLLQLHKYHRQQNRGLNRFQVCIAAILLHIIISKLVLLVAADGSVLQPHLSQTDKSMSELGPRILRGRDSVDGDRFGRAVALGPDLAVVGAGNVFYLARTF